MTTYDLGGSDHRLRLLLDDAELAALDRVRGRRHRPAPAARDDGGARDHARDPPGGAAGAVRARRPAARRARQRGRARSSSSRPCGPAPLAGTLTYASSVAAYDPPEPGHEHEQRGTPGHALRRLQARQRGDGGRLLGRSRDPEHRPAAAHGLRPRPRPGRDLGADQGDARGGGGHVVPDPLRRSRRVAARARRRAPVHRRLACDGRGRHRARPARAAGRDERRHRRDPRSRRPSPRARWDSTTSSASACPRRATRRSFVELLGDLPTIPLREGVTETIESFRGLLARGLVKPESALTAVRAGAAQHDVVLVDRELEARR